MDLNLLQLLDRRRHVKVYDTEDIPEEELIKDLLKKTWKVTPSKNNFMPYHCNVLGPDKKSEKHSIWMKSVNHCKEVNEKETTIKSEKDIEYNPYFEHINTAPYLLVFTQRPCPPNDYYKEAIQRGNYYEQMHTKDVDLILPDVSIEVGMFMANLSAFALEKDLHTSVLICFPRKFSRWSDMPWVRHPVILLGSIGKVKEFRRESMDNKEKRKDRKPGPEIVLKWI